MRSWTKKDLQRAVASSSSIRQVIKKLGLVEAGGNYDQVKKYTREYQIDTSHFLGKASNKGRTLERRHIFTLEEILVKRSYFQSHKLKKRLFKAGLKKPVCELCGWSKLSVDGRIPIELDHINGNHHDNRLANLRILCPNCHSLQSTHRGRNKKARVA